MTRTTASPDFEPVVAEWLGSDPDEAPRRVLDNIMAAYPSVPQRKAARWRPAAVIGHAPLWAAASILVLAVGGVLLVIPDRSAPMGGASRPASARLAIPATWPTSDAIALTIRGQGLNGDEYWRAATYDRVDATGWTQTDVRSVERPAGQALLEGSVDEPGAGPGSRTLTLSATPGAASSGWMVAAGTPLSADVPVRLTLIGEAGFFGGMAPDAPEPAAPYRMTVSVPVRGSGDGELNAAALRAAGTDYPADVRARYLQVVPGTLGPNARALRDRIVAEARSAAPFDLARQAETILRSPEFSYRTDLRGVDCGGASLVECFATSREGYCLHYATTMAVLLRDLGVPTRLVQGFLPGTLSDGVEVIRSADAHAWVEVYFPGFGWVSFDPTGGGVPRQVQPLP